MIKMSLQKIRNDRIYKEIEQPEIVYHMTSRANIEDILNDGRIKAGKNNDTDNFTYFFQTLEDIPLYIELTGADTGRSYYDFDRKIHKAAPLDHNETVILKLKPKGRQGVVWYKMRNATGPFRTFTQKRIVELMDECCTLHYGPMRFERNPEILELTDVDKLPPSEALIELRELKSKYDRKLK